MKFFGNNMAAVKKKMYFTVILVIIACFLLINIVQAVTAAKAVEPGSDGDPLVTESYVTKKLDALSDIMDGLSGKIKNLTEDNKSLSGKVSDVEKKVDDPKDDTNDLTAKVKQLTDKMGKLVTEVDTLEKQLKTKPQAPAFKVITLKAGQQVALGASTEALILSGKATAVKGSGGVLVNLSSGAAVSTGAAVKGKNLLLSITDDGRGLKASTGVTLLIKGTYKIK